MIDPGIFKAYFTNLQSFFSILKVPPIEGDIKKHRFRHPFTAPFRVHPVPLQRSFVRSRQMPEMIRINIIRFQLVKSWHLMPIAGPPLADRGKRPFMDGHQFASAECSCLTHSGSLSCETVLYHFASWDRWWSKIYNNFDLLLIFIKVC